VGGGDGEERDVVMADAALPATTSGRTYSNSTTIAPKKRGRAPGASGLQSDVPADSTAADVNLQDKHRQLPRLENIEE
jgi:hypothetical protein